MKNIISLSEGPISKSILKMTASMMIGMIGIVAFNLADTYFVGKLGQTPLAAMSFTFPVVMFQGAIALGLGVGASATISKAIGSKNNLLARQLSTNSLILSLLIVCLFTLLGITTITPLFTLLGATIEQLPLIKEYMTIWYLGVPFVVIPMVGNNAIRSTGNTFIPSMIMMTAVIINIILDPLFIFGIGNFPQWGLRGAAIATVIARAISLFASLAFLHFRLNLLTYKLGKISEIRSMWKSVLYIGAPAALVQMLGPISIGYVTQLIAHYGEESVAAFGVAGRIEMFALFPVMSISAVVVPFVGQNLGAQKIKRIKDGIIFIRNYCIAIGLLNFGLLIIFKSEIAEIFTENQTIIKIIVLYLLTVPISYIFLGLTLTGSAIFNAINCPLNSAAINIIRLIIILIPLTYLGSYWGGILGIFIAIMLTNILAGTLSYFWADKSIGKLQDETNL